MGAPETTWTGFDNPILGDSNGLRYTRQPRRIIRARISAALRNALLLYEKVKLARTGWLPP